MRIRIVTIIYYTILLPQRLQTFLVNTFIPIIYYTELHHIGAFLETKTLVKARKIQLKV